jgi:hypothetical protein
MKEYAVRPDRRQSALLLFLLTPGLGYSQGFDKMLGVRQARTTGVKRLLPATVNLNQKRIKIEATTATHGSSDELVAILKTKLVTMIQRDPRFIVDDQKPETILSFVVTNSYVEQKQIECGTGNTAQHITGYTGKLEVSYQAKEASTKAPLDSENLVYAISLDNKPAATGGKFPLLPGHHDSTSACGTGAKTTQHEAQDALVDNIVHQMAQRAAPTDEVVTVKLPGGKLERLSSLAMSARWGTLEEEAQKMEKLPKPDDDAYRLYLIALAKEAQAYDLARLAADQEQKRRGDISPQQAEQQFQQAQKFLDEARRFYQDAIQAKPGEKGFREPDDRMEKAIMVYATISRHKEEYQKFLAQNGKAAPSPAPPVEKRAADPVHATAPAPAPQNPAPPPAEAETPIIQIVKYCQANMGMEVISEYVNDKAFMDDVKASRYKFDIKTDPLTLAKSCGNKADAIQKLVKTRLAPPAPRSPAAPPPAPAKKQ